MRKKTKAVITAGHEKTAEAAALMLEEGGNAFDAAIAAFFAAAVTEPCMGSLGGGGFATIVDAEGKRALLDFFVQTPSQKRPLEEIEFYPITVDFGSTSEDFHVGMGSIGVPGMVSGIYSLYEAYATMPMEALAQPAIDLARNGVAMTGFQYFDIDVLKPIMTKVEESSKIFYPNGEPLPIGEMQYMGGMADYMEYLVKEGRREFYEGEAARMLLRDSKEHGGFLLANDLKTYETIWREPLTLDYRGRTVLTNPLPSTGGMLIGLALRELAKVEVNYEAYSKKHVQQMQEIMGAVYRIERTIENLTKKWGSTSHFNIVDEHGNAISTTFSNGEGCGYMIPGTNIMMNNMLGEAALLPNGFHNWEPSVRLSSMMAPTLVLDAEGHFEIATGSGGASRIPGVIVQVLHYILDLGLSVEEAVHASRMHYQHGVLNLEPDLVGQHQEHDSYLQEVINWDKYAMFFGGVHTTQLLKNGELVGAGDDRRDGCMKVVN
jgi:gamma-glutamyltranspeptidase/glutathione hydrolase